MSREVASRLAGSLINFKRYEGPARGAQMRAALEGILATEGLSPDTSEARPGARPGHPLRRASHMNTPLYVAHH